MEGPSATYNIPMSLRLTGDLDRDALRAALADVTARHEALRTLFPEEDGVPYQRILPADEARPALDVVDTDAAGAEALVAEAARQGFDLATELPLRATLFTVAPDEHVLLLLLHHIAGDGWSWRPLARDLSTAYAARRGGHAPTWAPLPVSYADYALWQRDLLGAEDDPDSRHARQLQHWTEALTGIPEVLELPLDRPRPAVISYRGDTVPFRIDPALHQKLLALAADGRASVFMVLQAAFATLLTKHGAGTDIPIGAPHRGPHRRRRRRPRRLLRQHPGAAHRHLRRPHLPRAAGAGARERPGRLRPPGPALREARRAAAPGALAGPAPPLPGHAGLPQRRRGPAGAARPEGRHRARRRRHRQVRPPPEPGRAQVRRRRPPRASKRPWSSAPTCSSAARPRPWPPGSYGCSTRSPPNPTGPSVPSGSWTRPNSAAC
ncbi:hypothetical protein GCM10020000_76340 [Streptomyces olivoverticillatus]